MLDYFSGDVGVCSGWSFNWMGGIVMKKLFLMSLAVFFVSGVLGVTGARAGYINLEVIDYFSWGTTYNLAGDPTNLNPWTMTPTQSLVPGTYVGADGTEDAFGTFQINKITDENNNVLWSMASTGQQLAVFYYGVDDVMLSYINLATTYSELLAIGLKADMYLYDSQVYNPNLGTSGRTGGSSYTNVTVGEKVLELVGATEYIDYPVFTRAYELQEYGYASTGAFTGTAYLDVVGGSWFDNWNTNTFPVMLGGDFADVRFTFTTFDNNQAADWLIRGVATGDANVVPEPSTSLMLGLGLLAMSYASRRKN